MKKKILKYIHFLDSNIATYPTIIALFLLCLSFVIVNVESDILNVFIESKAPNLIIKDVETSRSILSTLIGGIISLTVFSFSMVMVLLSQASSSFSPRLLPGLISDHKNQVVLGVYLGTIAFNIIILINLTSKGEEQSIVGFGVLASILLGFMCLAFFVFFIHSISNAIQIEHILKNIHFNANNAICDLKEKFESSESQQVATETESWFAIKTNKSNYFQGVGKEELCTLADELNADIKVHLVKGEFVHNGALIVQTSKELSEKENEKLLNCLMFSGQKKEEFNFVLGIQEITEVGIKAMSPGINDPGTAIITLNYLSQLFQECVTLSEWDVERSKGNHLLAVKVFDFETMLYNTFASYRQYCKHDYVLMEKLLKTLKYLLHQDFLSQEYRQVVIEQISILKEDAVESLMNESDRKKFLKTADVL